MTATMTRTVVEHPIPMSAPLIPLVLDDRKTQTRRLRGLKRINESPDDWTFDRWQDGYADGRRRAVLFDNAGEPVGIPCPYGQPGDQLWVSENFAFHSWSDHLAPAQLSPFNYGGGRCIWYRADGDGPSATGDCDGHQRGKWRPSIFMPRWASRCTLELIDVRIERVQSITDADAIAEGLARLSKDGGRTWKYGIPDRDGLPGTDNVGWAWSEWRVSPIDAFAHLWDTVNAARGYGWRIDPWAWALTVRRLPS